MAAPLEVLQGILRVPGDNGTALQLLPGSGWNGKFGWPGWTGLAAPGIVGGVLAHGRGGSLTFFPTQTILEFCDLGGVVVWGNRALG